VLLKNIEEIKQLVEFMQCPNKTFEGKMQFSCFPFYLPGIAEAQAVEGGHSKVSFDCIVYP